MEAKRPDGLVSAGPDEVTWLVERLATLRSELLRSEAESAELLAAVPPDQRASARNLIHYITLRRYDIRVLQERLAEHGFSSLGRAESHTLSQLDAVLSLLMALAGQEWARDDSPPATLTEGRERLERNTERLLGPLPDLRRQRLLVTMPSEAADDPMLVQELLAAGMDVMRINCAQDDPAAWSRMIENLRRAEEAVGRRCLVQMDLQGPGVRIGPIEPATRLVRVAPDRDEAGWPTRPAALWLTPVEEPLPAPPDTDL
ncbi:MAG: pyruvate kinase, partial [Gemmatimonadetes bacterium]|nr:pyruvate kinase [Gemmatimonadota bacterium]NIQ60203.1 pyruvate kinase [Gemmatimonadota bacterium]NIU80418.1 pyruvate kinase [Gammaproteobacteria bacterium]NIX48755.1 pyruvate kinase [Gemmatimonadota bacterium]NIY13211.1 pyruvate kinase [Gemmatimonadota bacterium]